MKAFLFIVSSVVLLQGCTSPPSGAVRGRGATYHYSDWRSLPSQKAFDVAPAPVGGMPALIARLDYPASLRARHVGGVMRVRVSLDSDGRVLDVRITESIDPPLDRIMINAVRHTKWTPAQKNYIPIPLTFTFAPTFTPP
ncbi:MAG: energy transducer TonB [Chthoniobacterales bacterium]